MKLYFIQLFIYYGKMNVDNRSLPAGMMPEYVIFVYAER